MKLPTIKDLVISGFLPDDEELLELVTQASKQTDAFLAALNIPQRCYEYVSPAVKEVTGYDEEVYLKDGLKFMNSRFTAGSLLRMVPKQLMYSAQVKKANFDRREVIILEFFMNFKMADDRVRSFTSLGVALVYSSQMDFEKVLALTFRKDATVASACHALLSKIKNRHNKLVLHKQSARRNEPLAKLFYIEKMLPNQLTTREEEVLKAIAKGLTTS